MEAETVSVYGLWTAQTPEKKSVQNLIISDTDANGVLFAAARARLLSASGVNVAVVSRFGRDWATRPNVDVLKNALEKIAETFDTPRTELIDIAVDNDHPKLWVQVVSEYAVRSRSLVVVYDIHPSTKMVGYELLDRGIVVVPPANNLELAYLLGLVNSDATDEYTRMLALAAVVADRDPAILEYPAVQRSEVEGDGRLLKLANAADVIVRNTSLVEGEPVSIQYLGDQGRVAALLAENPQLLEELAEKIEYPPVRLAREAVRVIHEAAATILVEVDGDKAFGWIPKTLERVAMMHNKDVVVAIVTGVDRRSGRRYWDVHVVRYWLSDAYTDNDIQRVISMVAMKTGATWRLSGGYGSVRLYDEKTARTIARTVMEELESATSTTARLLTEPFIARLVRSDFRKIYRLLQECCERCKPQ